MQWTPRTNLQEAEQRHGRAAGLSRRGETREGRADPAVPTALGSFPIV